MYSIREASGDDLKRLPSIERAAASLFRQSPYANLADGPLAVETFDGALHRVWVVVGEAGVAGFIMMRQIGREMYIQEIDVDPKHARRGLGRMLIEHVAQWARQHEMHSLTLITFGDVPWNGPYYSRLGFVELESGVASSGLRAMWDAEQAAGLPMSKRIRMQLLL